MTESCRESRFFQKHGDEERVLGEIRLQLFHDEELVESCGTSNEREINDAHSAARELRVQTVSP